MLKQHVQLKAVLTAVKKLFLKPWILTVFTMRHLSVRLLLWAIQTRLKKDFKG